MSGALIIARDGIAGSYVPPSTAPDALPADDPGNFAQWAPWVRGFTLESDLLGKIGYNADASGESIAVMHLDDSADPMKPEYVEMVRITRPTQADFLAQTALVNAYADLRGDRGAEVLDQVGFPTPFFGTIISLHPARNKYTLELIGLAQMMAAKTAMRVKHSLACLRPDRFSAQIMPMIPTPGHGALPSAHSVEAFIVARLLINLLKGKVDLPKLEELLLEQAARISVNRHVAGVHFPADTFAGSVMGLTLGDYLSARAGAGTPVTGAKFNGPGIGDEDFDLGSFYAGQSLSDYTTPGGAKIVEQGGQLSGIGTSALLNWLWVKAREEW